MERSTFTCQNFPELGCNEDIPRFVVGFGNSDGRGLIKGGLLG
jgi:hypothetical protein